MSEKEKTNELGISEKERPTERIRESVIKEESKIERVNK